MPDTRLLFCHILQRGRLDFLLILFNTRKYRVNLYLNIRVHVQSSNQEYFDDYLQSGSPPFKSWSCSVNHPIISNLGVIVKNIPQLGLGQVPHVVRNFPSFPPFFPSFTDMQPTNSPFPFVKWNLEVASYTRLFHNIDSELRKRHNRPRNIFCLCLMTRCVLH